MSEKPPPTTSVTLDLPTDIVDELQSVADQAGRDVSEVAEEALAAYLAVQRHYLEAVDRAIAEADAGAKRHSHGKVMAWMESWGKPDELPPPG